MSNIIDRRLNPRDKTLRNRQKFIERSRDQIKEAVKEAIDTGHIADIENGKAKIKVKGISEPQFGTDGRTGDKKYVMPGNKDLIVNDTQDKPPPSNGKSAGKEGGLGTGEDDFEFELNQEEFLDFIFQDMELPDLAKKQMKDVTKVQMKRTGFTNSGNPSQLDIVRSLKNSLGRRISLGRPSNDELEILENELISLDETLRGNPLNSCAASRYRVVLNEIQILKDKQIAIPWMDPFDVRYRNYTPMPQPMTKAVMFCILDVSGSMGKREKDLAKRFFFFLHMFLKRKYQKVDIIFIRHHETADEVDEDTFFNSRESGGTVVSSALKLTKDIINARYNVNDWNIYISQSSDGDNYSNDRDNTLSAIDALLPIVQYYAYVEISSTYYSSRGSTDLWSTYTELANNYAHMNMRKVTEIPDIWAVFKELFTKETA